MVKKYQEVPSNFGVFKGYVIFEKAEVINAFTEAHKYFFYDTCSILHHSNSANRQVIIDFIKSKVDILIVTRTVLMELTANSFDLHPVQVQYFKELFENGLKVVIFDEEITLDCLKEAITIGNEDANKLLGYAVKEVTRFKTKTNEIVNSMDEPTSDRLKSMFPGNQELYTSFFQYARTLKTQGDSLAEELILICIIVLTKVPTGSYILISDDLRIRAQVITVNDYILHHHGRKEPYQLTTASLIYKMYNNQIVTDKAVMLEILESTTTGNVNVFVVGEYDIQIVYCSFACEELINRLISEKDFRIIY